MVYPWALLFVKASILALYYRIFSQTRFRRAVYCVAAFVTIQTIVVTFVNVRQTALTPTITTKSYRPSNAAPNPGERGHPPSPQAVTVSL